MPEAHSALLRRAALDYIPSVEGHKIVTRPSVDKHNFIGFLERCTLTICGCGTGAQKKILIYFSSTAIIGLWMNRGELGASFCNARNEWRGIVFPP